MPNNNILFLMTILAKIFEKTRSGIGKCVKNGIHTLQSGNLNRHNLSVGLFGQRLKNFVHHLTQQFYCQAFTLTKNVWIYTKRSLAKMFIIVVSNKTESILKSLTDVIQKTEYCSKSFIIMFTNMGKIFKLFCWKLNDENVFGDLLWNFLFLVK